MRVEAVVLRELEERFGVDLAPGSKPEAIGHDQASASNSKAR
jgi:hypothetical protein